MPSKKKKYNARFPAGRIKKIMQTDEDVGKVAQAVPVIISRTLELFVESLLTKTMQITMSKNAKTLSPSHMKQCILSESRFDFLKDLVKTLPDSAPCDEETGSASVPSHPPERVPSHGIPPLPTPSQPPIAMERNTVVATEFEARLFPQPMHRHSGEHLPPNHMNLNPNYYIESQTLPSNFYQSPRSSTPPVLVVDEDYDT